MPTLTETKFWHKLMKGIYGPRQGGARIIVDAEDAATGVGKTGVAVALGQRLAGWFGYDFVADDLTLSGKTYLERWREHPDAHQPSVVVLDELAGAGAGDARRSMANQNVNLGRAWQLMRKKRVVSIVTLPHWSDADVRLQRFADYRLWCSREPIGYFVPYEVGTGFSDGNVITRRLTEPGQRIKFPNMDGLGDSLYAAVTREKDELLDSAVYDADELREDEQAKRMDPEEAKREGKIEIAQNMRNNGQTVSEVAEAVGMSTSWVSEYTENPEVETAAA